ncbi:hypothetical protein FRC11_012096, partial [Ceratobasidium sp. 423]
MSGLLSVRNNGSGENPRDPGAGTPLSRLCHTHEASCNPSPEPSRRLYAGECYTIAAVTAKVHTGRD